MIYKQTVFNFYLYLLLYVCLWDEESEKIWNLKAEIGQSLHTLPFRAGKPKRSPIPQSLSPGPEFCESAAGGGGPHGRQRCSWPHLSRTPNVQRRVPWLDCIWAAGAGASGRRQPGTAACVRRPWRRGDICVRVRGLGVRGGDICVSFYSEFSSLL